MLLVSCLVSFDWPFSTRWKKTNNNFQYWHRLTFEIFLNSRVLSSYFFNRYREKWYFPLAVEGAKILSIYYGIRLCYHLTNCADGWGWCPEGVIYLHNSSDHTKAESIIIFIFIQNNSIPRSLMLISNWPVFICRFFGKFRI